MSRFTHVVKSFPRTFWTANTLELFERWAYYGIFNLLAIYLTNSPETGALGFSQVEKGLIMGIVNAILYFLPIITGSIADKFGYKKVLVVAFIILSTGYFLMGLVSSFASVFITFFYVAIGAALFKPIISATIAKTTNEGNASLGFGIFYMIINIGGLIGPLVASELREISWRYMFSMSAGAILLNIIIVLFFFNEPEREVNTQPLFKSIWQVFVNIFNVLKDLRFLVFLAILICSWTVFWQYFYSLPVFIEQWVDTSPLFNALYLISPGIANAIGTPGGIILTEKIIALDAFFIVVLQILISTIIMKLRPLFSMTTGILINTLGLALSVFTRNPWFVIISILVFSLGEMTFSPKILEYIGRIAPGEKTALYMGTQFVPIALGNFIGGFISGGVYNSLSDKYELTKRLLPQLNNLTASLSNEQLFDKATTLMNTNKTELTQILWNTYHPNHFGFVLLGMGLFSVILLFLYDRHLKKIQ
jgi:proton-dependent oligopeptide transporter, POT family